MSNSPDSRPEHPGSDERRVTLQRVADAAGVSIATASHAYSRPDRISPETRERVLATGRSLGYSGPHPAARALGRGSAGSISVHGPTALADLFERPAAAQFMAGLTASLARAGLGISLSGGEESAGAHVAFRAQEPPVGAWVVADSAPADGSLNVSADIPSGANEIVRHLTEIGHRSLGIIGWEGESVRSDAVIDAWRDVGPARMAIAESATRSAGEAAARALLAAEERPTVVVAVSDELALGAYDACRHLNIGVPGQLSIVGFDDIETARVHDLTTAFVPYRPMGELAAALVLERLAGREPAPPALLPCALTVRRSTGPAA